jgi:transposase InsO family protein
MIGILRALGWIIGSRFKSRERPEAENLALRYQVAVLQRSAPKRLSLRGSDRLLFVWHYLLWPGVLNTIAIVKPESVVRWHRHGFTTFWRWRSRAGPGWPRIPPDVRNLIRQVSLANPLWGARRIHGELLKVGIEVAPSTVAKHMIKGWRLPSESWQTFLRSHAEGIASVNFFVIPTAAFKLLFGIVGLHHDRRRLVHIAVTTSPTADWVARQISEAFPWDTAPEYLIRDHDGAYGQVFKRWIKAMGIRDRPTAPRSPWQNGHVERLIGSIGSGPCNYLWQGAPALRVARLRRLLQRGPSAPVTEQRHATL